MSEGRLLHFAYGSNMLSRRLRKRTPSATPVSVGFVAGRRLAFDKVSQDGSGKCDIEATPTATDHVYGVIFEIDCTEKPELDRLEGLGHGYREELVDVVTADGTRKAQAYVATEKNSALRPYDWYKALVIAGALEHGLPPTYVDSLNTTDSRPDPDDRRRERNEALLSDRP